MQAKKNREIFDNKICMSYSEGKRKKSNPWNLKYDGMKLYVCLSFITFSFPYIDLHTDDMFQLNVYVYTSSENIILSIIKPSWEYVCRTQARKAIEMKKE